VTLRFTVYGAAVPKGSMRAFVRPGMRAPVITDGNRNVKAWQRQIAAAAGAAVAEFPEAERRVIAGAVRVTLAFYLPRPKALNTHRHASAAHTKRPDLDKLTRAVLDALTAIAWTDDAQVNELEACKRYAPLETPARVDIAVGPAGAAWPSALEQQLEGLDLFTSAARRAGVI
jgi:crossover junction endodeoxyribonuclease RusA